VASSSAIWAAGELSPATSLRRERRDISAMKPTSASAASLGMDGCSQEEHRQDEEDHKQRDEAHKAD